LANEQNFEENSRPAMIGMNVRKREFAEEEGTSSLAKKTREMPTEEGLRVELVANSTLSAGHQMLKLTYQVFF
jgi:hypothetical protein